MLDIETGEQNDGLPVGNVSVVVQLYDTAQGRIVAETYQSGSTVFSTRTSLEERSLHLALSPTVPWLVTVLEQAT